MPHSIWHPGILFSFFLSKGLVFYKDFANMHFPLSTFLVFPLYLISNWNLDIEPAVSLLIGILTLIFVFFAARTFLNNFGSAVAIIFFSIFYYFSSTSIQYSIEQVIGLMLSILIFKVITAFKLKLFNQPNLLLIGILFGLTELSGQIITLSLASLFLYIIYYTKRIVVFFVGILLSLIPLALYLIFNNALFEFFNQNIFFYSTYIKLANSGNQLSSLPWNIILAFYTPLIMGLPFFLNMRVIEGFKKNIFNVMFIMSAASIPSVVFSVFHPHHFLYILPVNALLAGLSIDLSLSQKKFKSIVILPIILLLIIFLTSILPWYLERIGKGNLRIINDVSPNTSMYNTIGWVKKYTKEDDRLLVVGDSLFYFRSNRLPSTKLYTVLPWHYKPIEISARIIQKNRPDYWVLDTNYLQRLSSPKGWSSPEISEFILQELKICYQKRASFDEWEIWGKVCT